MPNKELEQREEALRYAARLNGLTLIRTGDTFALADCKLTDVTLDEIAGFLSNDGSPGAEYRPAEENRRANLRALLKAEHSMMAEREDEKRKMHECQMAESRIPQAKNSPTTTESDLVAIRRRLAEIEEDQRIANETSHVAWQDIKHVATSLC
jgi:hypothetical protein